MSRTTAVGEDPCHILATVCSPSAMAATRRINSRPTPGQPRANDENSLRIEVALLQSAIIRDNSNFLA